MTRGTGAWQQVLAASHREHDARDAEQQVQDHAERRAIRVREIREHGFHGARTDTPKERK
jgi:hypothetical protein